MHKIIDLFALSRNEIDYRISALTESQLEILHHLTDGKSDSEISTILSITPAMFRYRIDNACDRVGVDRRAQLIAMYAIWKFSKYDKT